MRNSILLIAIWALSGLVKAQSPRIKGVEKEPLQEIPQSYGKPEYTLYLVGDVGDAVSKSQPVLSGLKKRLDQEGDNASVLFLGDNIYPEGLRKKNSSGRKEDEKRLNVQLDAVKDFKGRVVFVPGNHDWDKGGSRGIKHLKRQEQYIQKYLDRGNTFLPSHGCPGPEVLKVSEDLVIIIIDTQWWLHSHDKPKGEKDNCEVSNEEELFAQFQEALKKNRDKNVIVVGHHPLVSNGVHGGYLTARDHIFPLTNIQKNLYIPLPVLGSVYPLYRKYLGDKQDLAHPVYRDMVLKLKKAISQYDNVTYVAGHEHNLQYFQEGLSHFVISGSGSKATSVRNNSRLQFGTSQKGFARLMHFKNGEMWLEFVTYHPKTNAERISYRKKIYQSKAHKENNGATPAIKKTNYSGLMATVTPDSSFDASKVHRLFMGDMHRNLWVKPLKVPYLNIHYEKGGLTPIKKGGGMQSISLRLKGADGKQYVIRGIKKSPRFLIERDLRGTVAQDIIYDGLSGSHPYASVVVGSLSDAVGIYHTNPKLVYVPKDSILGDYLEEFGGMFCIFEERPDGDMSDEPSFGNSSEVMGYTDVYEKVHRNYHHQINYKKVLDARLFDMLIGDWDRHDDQWRWAHHEKKGIHTYSPIPRDRDQVFFRFDGVLPSIVNRKWLQPKFQPFKNEIRDIKGLTFNARYFDRSNLIALKKEDWIAAAEKIQRSLTDSVIEGAIHLFPREAFDFSGEYIIRTLKYRRDHLVETAVDYYTILAREVNVPGTFKDDYFEVLRLENGDVELNIYPRKKGKRKKGKRFFHRVFHWGETKEIRLYGLAGQDEYKIEGKSKSSIKVRIITGDDKGKVEDDSKVSGPGKKTQVYTFKKKDKIEKGKETRVHYIPKDSDQYEYNRKDFVYDKLMPGVSIGTNPNDGFYFGPAFMFTKQGFKKDPFKYRHKFSANRSFGAQGWNVYYDYFQTEVLGPLDFHFMAKANMPKVYQFYGRGNETQKADITSPFNVRMLDFHINPSLNYASKSRTQNLKLGLDVRHVSFDQKPVMVTRSWETEDQSFYGLFLGYDFLNQNKWVNPSRGVHFITKGSWQKGVSNNQIDFFKVQSALSLYIPLNVIKKQTVFAVRSGVAKNFGSHAFFQSNFLNGFKNFRGVTRNRFAGDAIQYNNFELRQSLLKVHTRIAPFDLGLLGHYDLAKSWVSNMDSDKWHASYGGGVFFSVLDYFMLQGTYSLSDENQILTVGTSFLF